ncbi:MAG: efflux RND transporter periplasmic adaptor subunit [Phycisphaeraceae bacterium]
MKYKAAPIIGGLVALALLAVLGWQIALKINAAQEGPPERRSGGAVAVQTAAVEVGPITESRTFTGTLAARSQFTVAPKIAGRVNRLAVDIGDEIERGQIIAWLDDEEITQQVEGSRAELMVAEATREEARSAQASARRELERVESLREQRIASESELDSARSQFDAAKARLNVAEAQVAQREAALRAAGVRLAYTQVRATWQGDDAARVVGERFVDEGDTLAANAPLVTVLNIETLRAVIYATERDYPRLAIGQQAEVTADAYRGESFDARVIRLAPRFREASRQARVELEVANADRRLKPGMFARVRLTLAEHDAATIVPLDAVVTRRDETGVFLTDDEQSTVRFVAVQRGVTDGQRVQVLDPPLTGRVVTLGQHLLEEGSAIRVVDDASDADDAADALAESAEHG